MIQILHHARPHQQGIGDGPSSRLIFQNSKFERKTIAMRLQKSIHAAGIGVKITAVARGNILQRRFGSNAQPQNSLPAIHLQSVRPDNF